MESLFSTLTDSMVPGRSKRDSVDDDPSRHMRVGGLTELGWCQLAP